MKATHIIVGDGFPDKFAGMPCQMMKAPEREKGLIGWIKQREAFATVRAIDPYSGLAVDIERPICELKRI